MRHLKILEQAGLIKTRREGRPRWNSLNEDLFQEIQHYSDSPFGDYRDWGAIRSWVHDVRPALLDGKRRIRRSMGLAGTILSYSNLSRSNLTRFDFRDSELVRTRPLNAKLQEADLHRANLGWANLSGTELLEVDLEGALTNFSTKWPLGYAPRRVGSRFARFRMNRTHLV